jgi:hypothetical protein
VQSARVCVFFFFFAPLWVTPTYAGLSSVFVPVLTEGLKMQLYLGQCFSCSVWD